MRLALREMRRRPGRFVVAVGMLTLLGVLLLATLVIGLPVYWILEPGRQAGATEGKANRFVSWGEQLFQTTANGGFNCAGCHGGLKGAGGQAPYAVTDPKTGEVKAVNWYAPALNTVFYRFSKEEVRFILNYGRPFSPMQAWGAPGGGPMTEQNIETLLEYLQIRCWSTCRPFRSSPRVASPRIPS